MCPLPGFQVFAKGGRNRGMPEEARQALQAAANGVAQTVRGAGGSQTVPEQMGRQTVQQTVQGDLGGQSASVPMGLPTVEQTEAPQKAIEDATQTTASLLLYLICPCRVEVPTMTCHPLPSASTWQKL